jgi:hypothetical protein
MRARARENREAGRRGDAGQRLLLFEHAGRRRGAAGANWRPLFAGGGANPKIASRDLPASAPPCCLALARTGGAA